MPRPAPLLLRALAAGGLVSAASLSAASAWSKRPDYPLAPGMAGLIAGVDGDVLIAAGGANFPGKMPWEGGKKAYYDEVFVLGSGDRAWRPAGRLPEPRAYAATVSTPRGVLVIGGENAETVLADTLVLRWDGHTLSTQRGPRLPAPRTSQVAAVRDGSVYVAGGYAPGTARVSTGDFWRLDLPQLESGWKKLPTWPGPTRGQAVMAATGDALYLLSGLEMTLAADGKTQPNYLTDAYCFRAKKWERLPDLPWSAVAAPSPAPTTRSPARVWVLGGVDGRLAGKQPRDTRVPNHIASLDVSTGRWIESAARWPDPVVTAPAVAFAGEWWIVSGEIMAGVRTTGVWSLRPELIE